MNLHNAVGLQLALDEIFDIKRIPGKRVPVSRALQDVGTLLLQAAGTRSCSGTASDAKPLGSHSRQCRPL